MSNTNALTLIHAIPVERDADGYWVHPGAPDTESSVEYTAWLDEQGLTYSIKYLESEDISHPVYVEYFDNNLTSVANWHPEAPKGEGWFTLSIHDTEEGPVWVWVRREAAPSGIS